MHVTPELVRTWLSQIEYKPNWHIEVMMPDSYYNQGLVHIRTSGPVVDAYNTEYKTTVARVSVVPEFLRNINEFAEWLRFECHAIECHEADEWLRWRHDRTPIFDPHE